MPYGSRIYQLRAKDAIFDTFDGGIDSTLCVLPTGCGKTVLSAMTIEEFDAMTGRRSLFLAHRETLINQAFDKFTSYGLDASVEMAGQDASNHEALFGKSQVVVGSIATMQKARLARWKRDEFGLIIVDEGHHADAPMHRSTIDHFQDAKVVYITATPKPQMGSFCKSKCFNYTLDEAINGNGEDDPGGWLVPPKIRKAMVSVDLRGIKTTSGGDFPAGDVEERLAPAANEIVDAIHQRIGSRQTVVFTPDCGSAQALSDLLQKKHGRSCEYVAGTGGKFGMSKAERKEKLDRYNRGEFQVLFNCELLFEGWDCPEVKCVVICRPTPVAMRYRYIQMVGRGLRPAPGTGFDDCIVVDLDWQADDAAKDLTACVDLYNDDSISDEAMDVARSLERAYKSADPSDRKDPKEIIEEAEEIVRVRAKLNIKVDPNIKTCKTIEVNPIAVGKMLDVKFTKKHDMDGRGNNPASAEQIAYLRALGIERPEGISKWGASKLLKKLEARKKAGLATLPQVKALIERGVDGELARNMSGQSASQSLAELAKMAASAARIQGSLF